MSFVTFLKNNVPTMKKVEKTTNVFIFGTESQGWENSQKWGLDGHLP